MDDKVVKYMQGKHGMIGIIISEGDPVKNREDLHRVIAEVALKRIQNENKKAAD